MSVSSQLNLVTNILGVGTLLVLILSLVYSTFPSWRKLLPSKTIPVTLFLASIGIIAGPLLYQYYFGFPPCTLCWYQRIFMWPIAFMILGTAFWRDTAGRRYILSALRWLAPAGLFFSVWHYISQWGLTTTSAACGAVGQSVSCDGIDVIVWGFMTIPLMAGIGFISLFLLIQAYTKK